MGKSICSKARLIAIVMLVVAAFPGVSGALELEMWECWGGTRTNWIKEYIAAFEAENPGITVNVMTFGCGDITPKFITAYAGGVAPDLIMFQTFDITILAEQGMLTPIGPFMERDGLTTDIWYPSEIFSGVWNGVQYGLPVRSGGDANTILYLNVDHFQEVGLDVDAPMPTLDALREAGQKLVRYSGDQISRSPMRLADFPGGDFNNLAWIYAGGGQFLSEDLRRPLFTEGGAVEVFEKLHEISQSWFAAPADVLWGQFEAQTASMEHVGAWRWSFFKENEVNFRVIPLPRLREDIPYTGAHIGTWHYVIPQTGKAPGAAWELLKWLATREDTLGDFLLRQGRLAPIVAFNENPEYLTINPDVYKLSEAMALAAPVTMLPISRDLMTIHGQAARRAMLGEESVRGALLGAAEVISARLDEYWGVN